LGYGNQADKPILYKQSIIFELVSYFKPARATPSMNPVLKKMKSTKIDNMERAESFRLSSGQKVTKTMQKLSHSSSYLWTKKSSVLPNLCRQRQL